MAIPKMSSQEFNNILKNATDKIQTISEEMTAIKNDVQKKLTVIAYEQEYLGYMNEELSFAAERDDNFIFLNNGKFKGLYEGYSNVVHCAYKNTPINIFNLRVSGGTQDYFRDEIKVRINDIEDDYFKNILKADTITDKEIFFEEYEASYAINTREDGTIVNEVNDVTTIEIERDEASAIGTSKFNVIEIDPYLYRSFDIESIEVYSDGEEPEVTISDIKNVGKTRFILDKKYVFKKVIFKVKHKYSVDKSVNKIFPFGLKHIFFLEADFRNDSYIIMEYTSEDYINDIDNAIEVVTSTNTRISTMEEEGLEVYLFYVNGVLQTQQEPSGTIKKPIARNIKTIYIKAPLSGESLIGYRFTIRTR